MGAETDKIQKFKSVAERHHRRRAKKSIGVLSGSQHAEVIAWEAAVGTSANIFAASAVGVYIRDAGKGRKT